MSHPSDQGTAAGAFLTFPLEDPQKFLIPSQLTIGIDEIRKTRASISEREAQYGPNGVNQSLRFRSRQPETAPGGSDTRLVESLADVDVPEARDVALVQQE